MKTFLTTVFALNSVLLIAQDSLSRSTLENKVILLTNEVNQIKSNQLNYKIEKDLIKETYSNNYDTISLILTGVVGLFGLFSFIGFRDVNSLKKEYRSELEKLKDLQLDIEEKSKEFSSAQSKIDDDIKSILEQNESQNRKIKILELREKIDSLYDDGKYFDALEFCNAALELDEENIELLYFKSGCHSKLSNYEEAISTLRQIIKINPDEDRAKGDLAEIYLFSNKISQADKIIEENYEYFKDQNDGLLLKLFDTIKVFNNKNVEKLKSLIEEFVDKKDLKSRRHRMEGWDFLDLRFYVDDQNDNSCQNLMHNFIWYLDGESSVQDLIDENLIEVKIVENKS